MTSGSNVSLFYHNLSFVHLMTTLQMVRAFRPRLLSLSETVLGMRGPLRRCNPVAQRGTLSHR